MPNSGWGAASDTGRHRSSNEDNYLATAYVFVVADGMGGHQAGEVASEIAINTLSELGESVTVDDVRAAVGRAHDEIVARASVDRSLVGMGTTLAGVAKVEVDGAERWAVFNVGDSRVYRRVGETLSQISVDHSEVQELIMAGLLTREQARTDFRRNIITRSLGADHRPKPDIWVLPPIGGEQFLVCSDGLTNELTDEQILEVLRKALSPQDAAQLLVAAAVEAGGHDNITVIVVGAGHRAERPEITEVDGDTHPKAAIS